MDQKEKDCAYWVAVLLAGLALGVAAGFVFGWLWREGPTSSEATKLVDVFIAVGTVGSAMTAIGIALWSKRTQDGERKAQSLRANLMASRGLEALCFSLAGTSSLREANSEFMKSCVREIAFYKNKISHAQLLLSATELERMLSSLSATQGQDPRADKPEEEIKRLNRVFSEYTSDFLNMAINKNIDVYSY